MIVTEVVGSPFTFANGRGQFKVTCKWVAGWTLVGDGSLYQLELTWDGKYYGTFDPNWNNVAANWAALSWTVPEGEITAGPINIESQCPSSATLRVTYPSLTLPTITYVKVSDLGDGRIWVDYGVTGKGNVKITIDGVIVKTFNNPYDNYSYGDAFLVSAGTHTVCVEGA